MKTKSILSPHLTSLICLATLVACSLPVAAPIVVVSEPESPGPDSQAEQEDATISWWLSPDLPQRAIDLVQIPQGTILSADRGEADVLITLNEGRSVGYWVYALVAPFPTILDEVYLSDVTDAWQGVSGGPFDGIPLLMSQETLAAFAVLWGTPEEGAVETHPAEDLLDFSWGPQPSWAIVPFDELQPRWKVLAIDGQSPIWKEFDPSTYGLSLPIGMLNSSNDTISMQLSNRNANKLTTLALTGVTALVRATADKMNRAGILYPAEEIGATLAEADITHISNEVPFWSECPPPNPVQRGLRFCSDPDYIELLMAVGTDVVELSGDHFNDYGQEAMLYTLDLYDEYDMPYYGGGHNLEEARSALILEDHGNRFAFVGCNAKRGYATASETLAGAVQCDYEWLANEISRLSSEGYLVISTFQHNEVYTFVPQPGLVRDFGIVAAAGASIVSGSQAHQSHGFSFPDERSFIAYGLGNLFFDQRGIVDYGDQALIARNVFYDGRYLSTELLTIQFVDFAKPRFMTSEERTTFLQTLFDASLWDEGQGGD